MDLRQLRYFVAAVEEGSLHAAAVRMHVAQPALSRRIRDLEASLGCDLLTRGARGVVPTPAGTTLYREAALLLDGLDRAGRLTRRAGLDQERVVRLGLVPTSRKYAFVQRAVAAYLAASPGDPLAFTHASSIELAGALREGRLDLSLLYERHLGSPAFGERLIHRERYILALHPDHRLAAPRALELAALAGEPLAWLSRRETEGHQDQLMQQCRLHGLEPVIGYTARSPEEQLDIVVASGGACLIPASTRLSVPDGMLAYRPLPRFGMELHLSLAWSADIGGEGARGPLARFHAAIDDHQARIADGRAAWARLHGEEVVRIEGERNPAG